TSFYKEEDTPNPITVYRTTKHQEEIQLQNHLTKYFILRTSWLYSEHGNNFMKTMIGLSKEKNQLSVVTDQIGTPTYATDLASVIMKLISNNTNQYGIYHYSNEGVASWYDFAKAIFVEIGFIIKLVHI